VTIFSATARRLRSCSVGVPDGVSLAADPLVPRSGSASGPRSAGGDGL